MLQIRPIMVSEIPLLEEFLYLAVFIPEGQEPAPREVIKDPRCSVYIDKFGSQPDDFGFVADLDGIVVGAVWTRILAGDANGVKGFGNIDEKTPEFAVSVLPDYRGRGIGTAMMHKMLEFLWEHGYEQTSLAVQKENYAVKMYEAVGFRTIKELEQEYLMVVDYADWCP